MGKKHRNGGNKKDQQIRELSTALSHNGEAKQEGPKIKSWSVLDLDTINPMTPAQEEMFHAWLNGYHIGAYGTAGTGKTFLALYLALNSLLEQTCYKRIMILRSAVSTRDIGFLPGDLDEKIQYYELPYHDIFHELVGKRNTYQDMKDAGLVQFASTSFIRGLTWDNAVIVIDEAENMTWHEINSIMTRIGYDTRVIVTGDLNQTDLDGTKKNGNCGMGDFLQVAQNMDQFSTIPFHQSDIVRSEFVKSWISAVEDTGIV